MRMMIALVGLLLLAGCRIQPERLTAEGAVRRGQIEGQALMAQVHRQAPAEPVSTQPWRFENTAIVATQRIEGRSLSILTGESVRGEQRLAALGFSMVERNGLE